MKRISTMLIISILCLSMFSVLARVTTATTSEIPLQVAEKAATWTISQSIYENGGYKWADYMQAPYYDASVQYGSAGYGTLYLELYKKTGNSMYLDYAKGAAQWIISQAVPDSNGYKWPHHDDSIPSPGWWLSPAVSGIGEFLLQMYKTTGDTTYLDYATGAGQWLMAMAYWGEPGCFIPYNPPNLYGTQASHGIDPAREAYTVTLLLHLYEETGNTAYLPYVEGTAEWLISGPDKIQTPNGYEWRFNRPYYSDYPPDGEGRIALFFYEIYQALGNPTYLQYAQGTMNWLLSQAIVSGNTAKWYDPVIGCYRTLPFSGSGMGGVAGFWGVPEPNELLMSVYDTTKNPTYLDYARKLANWIISPAIAVPEGGGYKFPDSEGGSLYNAYQNARIYNFLSWLYSVTGETSYRDYADGALQWIIFTATESNGGYEWITIPWFPYYATWFEQGAAGIGYYLATAPTIGLQPDFEISASPTSNILLHVGGSSSASLTVKSINGYSGSIQLSSSSPLEAKTKITFAQNPVDLNSGSEVTVSMHIASYFDTSDSRFGTLGEYKFVLSGVDGSIEHDVEITIDLVANTVAINNLVHLQQIPKNDPTFSVQQNFLIAASTGSVLYWAQNIVCVRPNPLFASGSRIWSTFQAFTENTNFARAPSQAIAWPYMGILAMFTDSKTVSFPIVLNLTSYMDGNDLVLTNNASSRLNTVRLTLPAGSYIVGYNDKYEHQFMGKTYGFDHASPEIAIVGTPRLVGSPTADFKVGTKGFVECSVKLFGESVWSSTLTRFMYANSNRPQTAERSLHLAWNLGNTFNYDKTINDPLTAPQGVSFSPSYP